MLERIMYRMTKALPKAIMRRFEIETKYFNNSTSEYRSKYKKQKSFCSLLYKEREESLLQVILLTALS